MKPINIFISFFVMVCGLVCPGALQAGGKPKEAPKGFIKLRIQLFTDSNAAFKSSDTIAVFLASRLSTAVAAAHPNIEFRAVRSKNDIYVLNIPVTDNWGLLRVFGLRPQHSNKAIKMSEEAKYQVLTGAIYWEPGDAFDIVCRQRSGVMSTVEVGGTGSLKYALNKKFVDILNADVQERLTLHNAKGIIQARIDRAKKVLDSNRQQLSTRAYQIMLAELLYNTYNRPFYKFSRLVDSVLRQPVGVNDLSALRKLYNETVSFRKNNIAQQYLIHSRNYRSTVVTVKEPGIIKYDLLLKYGKLSFDSFYYQIKKRFTGELRDIFIATYFEPARGVPDDTNKIYEDALHTVKTAYCLEALKGFSRLSGQQIKDFTFYDAAGKPVSFSALRGKVVLIDLWYLGCGPCAYFYQHTLSKVEEKYQQDSAFVVVSICQGTRAEWEEGLRSGKYTSDHAVNVWVDQDYEDNPFFKYYNIVSAPTIILLDKKGTIVKFDNEELKNYDRLMELISVAMRSK